MLHAQCVFLRTYCGFCWGFKAKRSIVAAFHQALLFMLLMFGPWVIIFYCTFCLPYFVYCYFCCWDLSTALTSEIATSSKVIRMLLELLRARVMTWPRLSDGWAGDTGTQTVLVCLKYSVSSFQALGSPLSQSPNTQHRPLKQDSSILENLALSTGSLD